MINIIIPCTPNYDNISVINTVNKGIDVVTQFVVLYNSMQKNWNSFDYRINLFYNKDMPFNDIDFDKLSKLDIDIYPIESDHPKIPFVCRCNALTYKVKTVGTHRLLLDTDMIALNEPKFDLDCDWQAMYANSVIAKPYYDYINKQFNYNLNLEGKGIGPLFTKYMNGNDSKDFFPHFNGGAFLMKEELCPKFKEYTDPSYAISHDQKVPHNIRHIGVQYGASFALMSMSSNWKPFERGFNFLAKEYDINKFGKDNISLLHYCGSNGDLQVRKHFNEYLK